MSTFALLSFAACLAVVAHAALRRGRPYAIMSAIRLGLHSLIAIALAPHTGRAFPLFAALHAATYLHSFLLARPRMRSLAFRALVSWPASVFSAATMLAFPWAIAAACGARPVGFWIPYAVALLGFGESLAAREEVVDVVVDGRRAEKLRRHRNAAARQERPLRIVQLTDTHLGPFMSEARLARICERAVAREPDLVLLTGDFLTMESQTDPTVLERALSPLRALEGRTFACMGNHDHEAPELVVRALRSAGVRLLVDDAATVDTPAGPVEIVGFDFRWRERAAHLAGVCAKHPRANGALRLALLHDPGAFKHLPPGAADLVLSGHTHGGQLGLLRLGLPYTIISALTSIPDHGLWARDESLLYVHRGTGHYGFPIRLGVPSEESLLQVHRVAAG